MRAAYVARAQPFYAQRVVAMMVAEVLNAVCLAKLIADTLDVFDILTEMGMIMDAPGPAGTAK